MATYNLVSNIPTKIQTGDILNCPYSGGYITIDLPVGTYKLECWGASGGSSTAQGGLGGYSYGTLKLSSSASLNLYSGGQGTVSSTVDAFNGGKAGVVGSSGTSYGGGGGGTDIRINSTSLYARVIVAGGGGGGGGDSGNSGAVGGAGGGASGLNGVHTNGDLATNGSTGGGVGATQTSGGDKPSRGGTAGTFGVGGTGYSVSSSTGSGGGGWYGGGGGDCAGGGGGSGYVYTSSTASSYPSGCELNESYYLTNAGTIAGNTSFTDYSGSATTGHSGDGAIRITVINPSSSEELKIYDYNYTGAVQNVSLPAGEYLLECWGAQGGSYQPSYGVGGKGGYSKGILTLKKLTDLFLYVGGQGSYYSTSTYTSVGAGGFNGGGNVGYRGGSGGGASDIRIGQDSFYSRVIVAGGGGGAYSYSSSYKANGGDAGGESGSTGSYYSSSYSGFAGQGGTQTSGGSSGTSVTSGNYNGQDGSFGQGGNTGYKYNGTNYYSNGAGGGGWYGGGAADNYSGSSRTRGAGGGGGSGYVYTSSTATNYPSGCTLSSSYYLTDAETIGGASSFTDPETGSSTTGRSGNGYIRITTLKLYKNTFIKVSSNQEWKMIKNIYLKKDSITWINIPKMYLKTGFPAGYTYLDSIEATSQGSYINTGFKPNNNTKVIIDYEPTNTATHIFGARTSYPNLAFVLYNSTSLTAQLNNSAYNANLNTSGRNTVEMTATSLSQNGSVLTTYSPGTFQCEYDMWLFNSSNASDSEFMTGKIYSCKIYDNETLVRNLQPAERNSDGAIGMYDKVNKVFYANAGSGSFTKGTPLTGWTKVL